MNKLTPMILAFLMLASTSLVALDLTELDKNENNEADGRVGPDAEVVSILSPRETTTDSVTGDKHNTINAGEDVNFEAFIQNTGDVAITEMGVTVTVYLSENGAQGMVALDMNGNELSWTNGDVICDDTFVCPKATLDAGELLDNGKHALTYQGAVITWTPAVGDYIIKVTTDAEGDVDPGNDYSEHEVSVVDWTDIIVELAWDSAKEVESGSDNKAFTLTVGTGGSSDWSARNVTVALDVSGTLTGATGPSGENVLGVTQVSGFGTTGVIETFRHETDANNTTTDTRTYLNFGDNDTWNGVVTPDSSGSTGDYSVSVSLVSYVIYGQHPDCEETTSTLPNGTNETVTVTNIHFCEVEQSQDDDASNSEDEILGKIETYHDIGITQLAINQGYQLNSEGEPEGIPSMPGMIAGPLNPGWGSAQVTVRHMGSDIEVLYDWEVEFTIENTATGISETRTADNCTGGYGEPYPEHKELGMDMVMPDMAMETGQACIYYEFTPGVYNVSAVVSMVGGTVTDMSSSNDDADMYGLIAMNNRPSVSLTLETEGDIIRGAESMITLVADAIDADDQTGLTLSYSWLHPGLDLDGGQVSMCNGMGPAFSTCNLNPLESHWAGGNTYSVTVSDAYGSASFDTTSVFVWNHNIAGATTSSGISIAYDLTYDGTSDFTMSTWEDSSSEPMTQDLSMSHANPPVSTGIIGDYTSVAIIDYQPSTTYTTILSQSVSIGYDTSAISPTSVWWISNGNWKMLDASFTSNGTDGTITLNVGDAVLGQGEIALMGGDLVMMDVPTANPTGLTMTATKGGDINAAWSYSGATGTGTWLDHTMCDSAGNCETDQMNVSATSSMLDGQTSTTHGETYTLTLKLCNAGGCNEAITPSESATADSMVDGDAAASEMSAANKNDNTWTISWTITGDATDVHHWNVCYQAGDWSVAGDMPTTCKDTAGADDAGLDISKAGSSGVYFFAVVPVDDKGNTKTSMSGTDIEHTVVASAETCETNPDLEGCDEFIDDGAESDGGVPPWTWGVIIGLVVVAFIGGAFILSRGGDGDEGKDWDY